MAPIKKSRMREKKIAMKFVRKILLLLLLVPALPAFGQEYPHRPITLIVPFSAGGPGDVIARLLGNSMGATLKQSLRPHPMATRCC
jgi:tripartite-type tricarboxylate transporter receptor subunit TctC